MKKHLIPENGHFYKAALHLHTQVSDGKLSVEDMKQEYVNNGFSIVSFSDHEIFVTHNDLSDEGFLALNSVEVNISDSIIGYKAGWPYMPTYHLNLHAKIKDMDCRTVWEQGPKDVPYNNDYLFAKLMGSKLYREYRPSFVNEFIKRANKAGFLVCYNHPVAGLQNYKDYCELEGLWAVEWYNGDSTQAGMDETILPVDDLLRLNKRVFPVAGDDAHDVNLVGKSFTMVKAENLQYESVIEALEKGHFYSSTAPEIYELYIEDGCVHIKCSNVRKIALTTERREGFVKTADTELINEAVFDIRKYAKDSNLIEGNYEKAYIRMTLTDAEGNLAQTVPYFLKDLEAYM